MYWSSSHDKNPYKIPHVFKPTNIDNVSIKIADFLNQVCTGHRPACAKFPNVVAKQLQMSHGMKLYNK